jgi:hypothetical protein
MLSVVEERGVQGGWFRFPGIFAGPGDSFGPDGSFSTEYVVLGAVRMPIAPGARVREVRLPNEPETCPRKLIAARTLRCRTNQGSG